MIFPTLDPEEEEVERGRRAETTPNFRHQHATSVNQTGTLANAMNTPERLNQACTVFPLDLPATMMTTR
jgi:hypothetical protein